MPSDGASNDHSDDVDDHNMIKCSALKRRKRKTKPYGDQGKGIAQGFGFGDHVTPKNLQPLKQVKNDLILYFCAHENIGRIIFFSLK